MSRRARRRAVAGATVAALLGGALPARGASAPPLRPGAMEAGLSGSLISVAGNATGSVAVSGTRFLGAPGGLAAVGAGAAYAHTAGLGRLDLFVEGAWTRRAGDSALYPFAGVVAGLRQEWVGSFRLARYPVGIAGGVRAVVSERAALEVEARLLRVLHDPVADYTEVSMAAGIGLLFGNGPPR